MRSKSPPEACPGLTEHSLFQRNPFQPRNYPRAASLALTVFAGWPLSDAFQKIAREAGIPLGEILLSCGLGSLISISLVLATRHKLDHLKPRNWKGLALLGLLQLVSLTCWIKALPEVPLANMYIISFLAPMSVACLAAVILKEPLGWGRAIAIAVGFIGVVVAMNPQNLWGESTSLFPYLLLVGNMISSSVQMFLLRLVADKEHSESTAFYSRVVVSIGGLLLCFFSGVVTMDFLVFLSLCGAGILGGLGWTLLAEAYKYAPAAAVAPFQYTQMIWGSLLGYIIWNELPQMSMLFGSLIIIASGVYLVRQERRISRTMPRLD